MSSMLLPSILAAVLVAVVLLLVLLLRVARGAPGATQRAADELQAEREAARQLAADSGRLQGRLGALEAELAGSAQSRAQAERVLAEQRVAHEADRIALAAASAALGEREAAIEQARARAAALEGELDGQRAQLAQLRHEHAQATANLEHAARAQAEMRAFLDEAQSKLSAAFAEQAGKVFDERGQVFEKQVRHATAQGKVDIETLLKPFADKLGEFRSRVDTLYGEEAKERSALLGAVTELKTLNQDMAGHTAALTRALKGSAKVRGDWGELMLESVLRGSGLEEGRHYERQAGLRDDEDGRHLRPDIIVRLPDERCVVVDSKVNLVAWQEAMNSIEEPELHNAALQRHADGLRRHVKDLGERAYPRAVGDTALDVTIAFVPIEGALSAALGFDPTLQTYAFDRKVVFASPNTLMALLRVVDRLWVRDTMQRRALEIGDAGNKVLDALTSFLADFDTVGRKLDDAARSFVAARRRLSESSQAVIPRARRLAELGAKGKRALPDELKAATPGLLGLEDATSAVDGDAAGGPPASDRSES